MIPKKLTDSQDQATELTHHTRRSSPLLENFLKRSSLVLQVIKEKHREPSQARLQSDRDQTGNPDAVEF